MVNVTCCGRQDRNTTTSAMFPNRPPNKTRNCYTEGLFEYMECDEPHNACMGTGIPDGGGCSACFESSHGGYCKVGDKYYTSHGGSPVYMELTHEDLIELTSPAINSNLHSRRTIMDYDRMITNRIRELQIMGRDPLPQRSTSQPSPPPPPPPSLPPPKTKKTTDILFYIGIIISLLILTASITFILIQKKIIKI